MLQHVIDILLLYHFDRPGVQRVWRVTMNFSDSDMW